MKISKIFAAMSAAALASTLMAMTAFAGQGSITSTPDGWSGAGTGMAKRIVIGAEADTPALTRDDQAKMADITTVRVTVQLENAMDAAEGYGGSIVVLGSVTGWGQHDWHIGAQVLDEEGNINPDVNPDLKIYSDGDLNYTIEYSDPEGIFKAEDPANEENYYGIAFQNFGGSNADGEFDSSWAIAGMELLDASGNVILSDGTVVGGDEWSYTVEPTDSEGDTSSADDTSKADDSSKADESKSDSKADSSSKASTTSTTTSKSSTTTTTKTSTTTSKAASDATESSETGAAAGVGLAIAALAGAAIVVSRRK